MGFVLGMVLAGVGGLSAETYFFNSDRAENSKKLDQYWAETGLSYNDVTSLISNKKCYSSGKYYKACLNALSENLNQHQLVLNTGTGRVNLGSERNQFEELTESEALSEYLKIKAKIDFDYALKDFYQYEQSDKHPRLSADLINGFMSVYFDPHTYIVPSSYYSQVGSKIERSKYFVGISYERRNGDFIIQKVSKNSDADYAGLKLYDKIISINGRKLKNLSYTQVSQILRDEEVANFKFVVERESQNLKISFDRSYRMLSHVQFNVLSQSSKYGLLTLSKFSKGVCFETSEALKAAQAQNLKGLILDMRDNPGGQLDEASCIAGLFLGKNKKAYYIEYLEENLPNEVVLTSDEQIYSGPLVVLVNHRSASAAESLSGALQDYKRGTIVGRRTFGKGTFQEPEDWLLNDKISLFKTQGLYLLPSRNTTQAIGVKPDIELPAAGLERREEDYFANPIRLVQKEYPALKKSELSKNFEWKNCEDKKASAILSDDIYLRTSLNIMNCALRAKATLAQAEAKPQIR
jgi:carboxyl-terminal processing protease